MIYRLLIVFVSLFSVLGCTASSADLNKMAQDSLRNNKELKVQAIELDRKFVGSNEKMILDVLGKPQKKSNEPYPYKLNVNCHGKNCDAGYSDEIWFYEFKRKFPSGWEAYSVYVYFKDGEVVRIR